MLRRGQECIVEEETNVEAAMETVRDRSTRSSATRTTTTTSSLPPPHLRLYSSLFLLLPSPISTSFSSFLSFLLLIIIVFFLLFSSSLFVFFFVFFSSSFSSFFIFPSYRLPRCSLTPRSAPGGRQASFVPRLQTAPKQFVRLYYVSYTLVVEE